MGERERGGVPGKEVGKAEGTEAGEQSQPLTVITLERENNAHGGHLGHRFKPSPRLGSAPIFLTSLFFGKMF